MKSVCTARGYIESEAIRKVLIHEHVFNRYPYYYRNKSNEFTLRQLIAVSKKGVNLIVDLTAYTKPYNYYPVIDESPIEIVTCLGFYTNSYIPKSYQALSADKLYSIYKRYIEVGVGERKIKPGILKVAAPNTTTSHFDDKYFTVVAKLSREYDLPIALHAPKDSIVYAQKLLEMGVRPSKLMVAHMESGILSDDIFEKRVNEALALAQEGVYVQVADFGNKTSSKRCEMTVGFVNALIRDGYINKILVSSDSNWRWKSGEIVLRDATKVFSGKSFCYALDHSMRQLTLSIGKDMEEVFLHDNALQFLLG